MVDCTISIVQLAEKMYWKTDLKNKCYFPNLKLSNRYIAAFVKLYSIQILISCHMWLSFCSLNFKTGILSFPDVPSKLVYFQ